MADLQQDKEVLVTKAGLAKLKEELREYREVGRKEVAQRLKEAIAYGDLSENSEYEEAKNEQAFVEGRIVELEKMISNARIIADDKSGQDTVQIGTTVKIQNTSGEDDPETITIVGTTEADPINSRISNESPIGSAIIGKAVGDSVKVKVPAGIFEYKILKIK